MVDDLVFEFIAARLALLQKKFLLYALEKSPITTESPPCVSAPYYLDSSLILVPLMLSSSTLLPIGSIFAFKYVVNSYGASFASGIWFAEVKGTSIIEAFMLSSEVSSGLFVSITTSPDWGVVIILAGFMALICSLLIACSLSSSLISEKAHNLLSDLLVDSVPRVYRLFYQQFDAYVENVVGFL